MVLDAFDKNGFFKSIKRDFNEVKFVYIKCMGR